MAVQDALLGALLIALGVFALWALGPRQLTKKILTGNAGLWFGLLVGLALILGGGWLLFRDISLEAIRNKLIGLVLFAAGFFFVFHFPDITGLRHQPERMSRFGIFLGLFLLILGLYMLLFL